MKNVMLQDGNPNLTEIVFIFDKSGSMDSIKDDAIGGFNSFLDEQKKIPGEAIFSMTLFDSVYEMVCNGVNLQSVLPLNKKTYIPSGYTALNDAIGTTIEELQKRIEKTESINRPGKIIVGIMTDGGENSSRKFNTGQIKEKIEECKKIGWEFVFLAANQDAFETSSSYGISKGNTMNFAATADGTDHMYKTLSRSYASYRGMKKGAKTDNLVADNENV